MLALRPPSCLASAAAFTAAPPNELAAVVVYLGFGDQLDQALPEVDADEVFHRLVDAIGLVPDLKSKSFKWFGRIAEPEIAAYASVLREGIVHAEQRLLVYRNTRGDHAHTTLSLLRRGHALLTSGDVATYLP